MTAAFVRRAWPLGALLLALSAMLFVPNDRGYFPPHQFGVNMENATLAANLALSPGFLYYKAERRDDGRLRYAPYHRFPVAGYALIKLAMAPFAGDLSAQLRAARWLMALFWCAAAVLAYFALARLTGSRALALLATSLGFSSLYMLRFHDAIAPEVSMDLFGVMLTFHGTVVFAREGRFWQLVAKVCVALGLGWHAYALVGPFVAFGLAAGAVGAWRRGVPGVGVARRLFALARGLRRSRHALLGVVAVLFGAGVLGGNVALERGAFGGDRPLAKLPTVDSALFRTGIHDLNRPFDGKHRLVVGPGERIVEDEDWFDFWWWQWQRVGVAALPYAVYGWFDSAEARILGTDARTRGWPLLAGVGVAATVLTTGLLLLLRGTACAGLYLRVLAPLASSGFCWTLVMRRQTHWWTHSHEGLYYFGLPLAGWVLAWLWWCRSSSLGVRSQRVLAGGALCAALALAGGYARWAEKRQYPREAATQRELMAEFSAIREVLSGRDVLVCASESAVIDDLTVGSFQLEPFWGWRQPFLHYVMAGTVPWYAERLRDAEFWAGRGAPNRVLCPQRVRAPSLRTPTHRHVFLYDSLDVVDAIARAWRREYDQAAATPLVARSAWDFHWDGSELAVLKAPCADADLDGVFSVLAQGTDAWTGAFGWRRLRVRRYLRRFHDRCAMRIRLVGYGRVRAAFAPSGGAAAWRTAFRLDRDALLAVRAAAFGTDSAPALEGAGFLVRQHGDALVYLRSPCEPADVEARFFLHVTPVSMAELPAARQQAGFDNLDFAFGEHGAVVDDACVAKVPLPDYAVAEVRTGQFADAAELWAARLALGGARGNESD